MELLFYPIATILLLSAVGVVLFRSPFYSALSLIANLFMVACLFAMLNAHFLAVVQIIVYAGAIMVLVIFVIMLLNLQTEEKEEGVKGLVRTVSAVIIGVCFLAVLVPLFNSAFSGMGTKGAPVIGSVENIGKLLYMDYVFPFEAASILIMAAIVGAVMLARRKYR